jgi:predicted RNA-binding Zn ribbon-like protein
MALEVKAPEERAFELISGHPALDLLATLRDRHGDPVECLRRPADLDRWLALASLAPGAQATHAQLAHARELRETIDGAVRALLRSEPPRAADVRELNAWARQPALAPQLAIWLELRWTGGVDAALATLACGTVELLSSPDRELIRECAAAPTCSRVYLDRSRARGRRWCSMERCGSSAKMRSYRRRHKTPVRGPSH